jgi:hypothetical protein
MKRVSKIFISVVLTSMLLACDKGRNTASVSTEKSAQKAAVDFSKTFKQSSTTEGETGKQSTANKKPKTDSVGIVGVPIKAVEGVKSVVDETKEVANKMVDKVSEVKKSVIKATTGEKPEDTDKPNKVKAPAQPVVSAQDAAKQASKIDKSKTSDIQFLDQGNLKISSTPKKITDKSGIAGMPKAVVEEGKSIVEKTKEIVSDVVDKVSVTDNSKQDTSNSDPGYTANDKPGS